MRNDPNFAFRILADLANDPHNAKMQNECHIVIALTTMQNELKLNADARVKAEETVLAERQRAESVLRRRNRSADRGSERGAARRLFGFVPQGNPRRVRLASNLRRSVGLDPRLPPSAAGSRSAPSPRVGTKTEQGCTEAASDGRS